MIPIDYRLWKVAAFAGLAFMTVFVALWAIMSGNLPPLGANQGPEQVKAWFVDNGTRISIGTSICLTITSFYMVWSCAIAQVMRRVEGPGGLFANLEMMGGVITVAPITVAMGCFLTCALEAPILDPTVVHALYWLGWMVFDLAYMVTSFQIAAISLVFLRDRREKPLVPSFVSWWGVVTIATFFPVSLVPFVRTGPFAFNGTFNFWIAFFAWFIWCPLLSYYVIKAVDRIKAEDEAAGLTTEVDVATAAGQVDAAGAPGRSVLDSVEYTDTSAHAPRQPAS
jgi:amino acid transporter